MATIKINSGGGSAVTINKPGAVSSVTVNRETPPPSVLLTALDGHTIQAVFEEATTPDIGDWAFNNGSALTINTIEGAGTTWLFDINETMEDGESITADISGNPLSVVNSIHDLQLITGNVSMTNCSYADPLISSSGAAGWGHTFLENKSIPADAAGRVMFKFNTGDYNGCIGIKTTNAEGSHATFKFSLMVLTGGALWIGWNGNPAANTTFTPLILWWLGILRKSDGTAIIQWSNDQVYWNDLFTIPVNSTSQLWVVGDLYHPGKLRSSTFELCNEYTRPASSNHRYNCNIIGDGNSLMAGYGLTTKMDEIMVTKYPFRRSSTHWNKGQIGATTTMLSQPAAIDGVAAKFKTGVVNYLMFWEMCNYIQQNGTNAQNAVDAVTNYCSLIYAKAVEQDIDLRIVLLTTFRRTTFSAAQNLAIDQANQLLIQQWDTMDGAVGVADVGGDSRLLNPADTTYFNVDGIHQSELGLQIAEQIAREKLITL